MKDPRAGRFKVVLSCGCWLYTRMRPHRATSSFTCRSNQGHPYNQPWASVQYPGCTEVYENPLLTRQA